MTALKVGDKAPEFEGKDQDGHLTGLKDFKGKKVVLYFYPRDNTPGCTAEACNLRDNYSDLLAKGFVVIGVSPDNETSHLKFKSKFELPFILIADPEKQILQSYQVWGEKNMYGKKVMGVMRTTFIIDEKGYIAAIIRKVNTADHTTQILKESGII